MYSTTEAMAAAAGSRAGHASLRQAGANLGGARGPPTGGPRARQVPGSGLPAGCQDGPSDAGLGRRGAPRGLVFVSSRLVAQSTFLIAYASCRPVLRLGKLRAPGCDRPSLFPQDSGWKSVTLSQRLRQATCKGSAGAFSKPAGLNSRDKSATSRAARELIGQ